MGTDSSSCCNCLHFYPVWMQAHSASSIGISHSLDHLIATSKYAKGAHASASHVSHQIFASAYSSIGDSTILQSSYYIESKGSMVQFIWSCRFLRILSANGIQYIVSIKVNDQQLVLLLCICVQFFVQKLVSENSRNGPPLPLICPGHHLSFEIHSLS